MYDMGSDAAGAQCQHMWPLTAGLVLQGNRTFLRIVQMYDLRLMVGGMHFSNWQQQSHVHRCAEGTASLYSSASESSRCVQATVVPCIPLAVAGYIQPANRSRVLILHRSAV